MGKSTISTGPFSIAMLNYQRVSSRYDLVGGLEHECYDFPYIGNVIIPTEELHYFSEGFKPPTRISFRYDGGLNGNDIWNDTSIKWRF